MYSHLQNNDKSPHPLNTHIMSYGITAECSLIFIEIQIVSAYVFCQAYKSKIFLKSNIPIKYSVHRFPQIIL